MLLLRLDNHYYFQNFTQAVRKGSKEARGEHGETKSETKEKVVSKFKIES
jgi:hypothetical protein